jgi:hypothetical protein
VLSKVNAPARVNSWVLPLRTTKKPSPWIIRSVDLPVFWAEPWAKFVLMPPSWTPRPTCSGFRPPSAVLGEEGWRTIWLSVSSKTTELLL